MSDKYLKISELARLLNETLELYIGESNFEGELQELTRASSGHLYCTIKDEFSAVSIVLWAGTVRQLKFKPEKGLFVRCQGKPNVYAKTGRLQIVVSRMEPAGEGALQQKFEELRKKLTAEGLFALERKRAIPFLPNAIGLITSAQGAVVHDVMTRLQDRMPHIPVFLVDVRVQGQGAAAEIAQAIQFLSESEKVDVIICGRGGGSLQDLWSFNEEVVVRAIFASKIPVISAVGHEIDITLADLVADLRAPTPTAAAEMVVPKRSELQRVLFEFDRRFLDYSRWLMPKSQELDEIYSYLEQAIVKQFAQHRLIFEIISGRLKMLSPHNVIEIQAGKIFKLTASLESTLRLKVEQAKNRLNQLQLRLVPARKLEALKIQGERLGHVQSRMLNGSIFSIENRKNKLEIYASKLESLNPESILQRGFSIARKGNVIISSIKQAESGDKLAIQLRDGRIDAIVG